MYLLLNYFNNLSLVFEKAIEASTSNYANYLHVIVLLL